MRYAPHYRSRPGRFSRIECTLAFTLVELLIVVVILGILAAIVVPQFSTASDDSKLSAMTGDLAVMRKQIELYRAQHLGNYPRLATFVAQMTGKSNSNGAAGGTLGPYIRSVPINPFTG